MTLRHKGTIKTVNILSTLALAFFKRGSLLQKCKIWSLKKFETVGRHGSLNISKLCRDVVSLNSLGSRHLTRI